MCVRRRDINIGLDESGFIKVLMYLVYCKLISELGSPLYWASLLIVSQETEQENVIRVTLGQL